MFISCVTYLEQFGSISWKKKSQRNFYNLQSIFQKLWREKALEDVTYWKYDNHLEDEYY
jgi:hypothetical protein